MAEMKDMYKLGQSNSSSINKIGQEIRLDLELQESIGSNSGTVFGKTLDGSGAPVTDVTVKITDNQYNPLYHSTSDKTGTYSINNVEAGKQYLIFAAKDNYKLAQGTQFLMQTNQQIDRNFVMIPDDKANVGLVAGEVASQKKALLEGVTVKLFNNSGDLPVLLKTTHTNQFGQYAFFDIAEGLYLISADLLGYQTDESTFIMDKTNKVRNILIFLEEDSVTSMGTVNGIIKDKNGNAIADAYVILFAVSIIDGKESLTPIRKAVTNDEGLYLFEQVPEGNYKIKANKLK